MSTNTIRNSGIATKKNPTGIFITFAALSTHVHQSVPTIRSRLKLSMSTPTIRFIRNKDPIITQTKKYNGTHHASYRDK